MHSSILQIVKNWAPKTRIINWTYKIKWPPLPIAICTCLAYNLIWKKGWNFSVRWCRKGRKLYFARKKMMTAGKNNGAKPFLMAYFNSYIHKISFEYLIVFYLPIARVECFLKYSLKKKFKWTQRDFDPIVAYRPWLGHKKW